MSQKDTNERDKQAKIALTIGIVSGSIVTALAVTVSLIPPLVAAVLVSVSAFLMLAFYADGAGWLDEDESASD